ncbi:hypothetical protein B0J18DRAFT_415965 [Chaetomium sp. MPI-SDFR-AT-0129]|nr:hypothetical protein B0J18DRAFT_415965 [Chaetomium sp. MPI-SDFR-AT-0129]
MLRFVLALVAAAQFAVALPKHKIPLPFSSSTHNVQFCVRPEEFVVKNFQIWTPKPGNNQSTTIDFDYADEKVMPYIITKCHFNETSVNVGPKGSTPRYACENKLVEFIWSEGTLTLIERVCPLEDQNVPYEAAGWVEPNLQCSTSTKNDSRGAGHACSAKPSVLAAEFTSLEPTPN